jgi:hypothetical protein
MVQRFPPVCWEKGHAAGRHVKSRVQGWRCTLGRESEMQFRLFLAAAGPEVARFAGPTLRLRANPGATWARGQAKKPPHAQQIPFAISTRFGSIWLHLSFAHSHEPRQTWDRSLVRKWRGKLEANKVHASALPSSSTAIAPNPIPAIRASLPFLYSPPSPTTLTTLLSPPNNTTRCCRHRRHPSSNYYGTATYLPELTEKKKTVCVVCTHRSIPRAEHGHRGRPRQCLSRSQPLQ